MLHLSKRCCGGHRLSDDNDYPDVVIKPALIAVKMICNASSRLVNVVAAVDVETVMISARGVLSVLNSASRHP